MRTAPYDLGVDSGGDGLSVTGPAPRLSWKDPVERDIRSAYLVEAEIDGAEPILAEASGRRLVRWPFGALGSTEPGAASAPLFSTATALLPPSAAATGLSSEAGRLASIVGRLDLDGGTGPADRV